MVQPSARPPMNLAAVFSTACVVLQLAWVALCYHFAETTDLGSWLGKMFGSVAAGGGIFVFSTVGTACGIAGRRSTWGKMFLILNAIPFLGTSVLLLWLLLPNQ